MIHSLAFCSPGSPEETSEPIELFSSNPKDYRSDVLRKIIPLITNPSGKICHVANTKMQLCKEQLYLRKMKQAEQVHIMSAVRTKDPQWSCRGSLVGVLNFVILTLVGNGQVVQGLSPL